MFSPHNNKKISRIAFIVVLIMLIATVQTPAAVRSIRSRTLGTPSIVMQGIAKVTFDTLLGERMIQVTVANDSSPTTIQIDLLLKIETDDPKWDGELTLSLLKYLAANETFTFDNSTVATQINSFVDTEGDSGFQLGDFDMGDGDFDGGYPGGFTMDDFNFSGGNIDLGAIKDLFVLPEGVYTIALNVQDAGYPAEAGQAPTNIAEYDADLMFKIVNIGEINLVKLPSVDDQTISWQLPEIPNYDTTATNDYEVYSILNISGKDVNFTKQIKHANPTGTGIKGYPGGTASGLVTLDLSSYNLKFRMGESYTFTLELKDWASVDAATPKTRTLSYTSETPSYFSPSQGGQTDSLFPTFEWAFDEYEDWISYYDLYINGIKQNSTRITDEYYTLSKPLAFGTSYSWHVVPYYADWTPFYSPTSPPARSQFSTIAHTAPEIILSGAAEGDQLLTGEQYQFSVSAETFNDADVESVIWTIGGTSFSGEEISFTPDRRYTGDSLAVICSVTDSAGGISSERINVSVLDPAITISGGDRSAFANSEQTFAVDSARTRDAQDISWSIISPDGSQDTESGTSFDFTFGQLGTFTISATAVTEDSIGNKKEVSSTPIRVTVTSQGPPQVAIQSPASMALIPVEEDVPFTASMSSPNEIVETVWTVNGRPTSFSGMQEEFTLSADSALLSGAQSATMAVACRVTDEFGATASSSRDVVLIQPEVTISNITEGARWSLDKALQPMISAAYAENISWFVDGQLQSGVSHTFGSPGTHSIRAQALWNLVNSSGSLQRFERDIEFDIYVIDSTPPALAIRELSPPSGVPLLTDVSYRFIGEVTSDSEVSRMWWVIGSRTLETDDGSVSYSFPSGSTPSSVKATFYAENADGVVAQKSIQLAIADPVILVQQPSSSQFPVGGIVPIFGTVSSGTLLWSIEGTSSDGQSISSETTASAWDKKFSLPGSYTLRPGWSLSAAAPDGGSQVFTRYSTDEYSFTIYSTTPPEFRNLLPQTAALKQIIGAPISFTAESESQNGTAQISWSILSGGSEMATGSGSQFTYTWTQPGTYTVLARAADPAGLTSQTSWSVLISDPQITLTYPEDGKRYGNRALGAPKVTSSAVFSVAFFLDGSSSPVPAGFDWGSLSAGEHTIRAEGTYTIITDDTGTASATLSSTPHRFTLTDLAPPEVTLSGIAPNDRVLADSRYTASAAAIGIDGANIESISWTLDGQPAGTGEQIQFDTGRSGVQRSLSVTSEDQYGLTTTATVPFRVIEPAVEIILPEYGGRTGIYPADEPVTLRYTGTDVEEITWILNGREYEANMFRFSPGSFTLSALGSTTVRLPDGSIGTHTVEPDQAASIQAFALPELDDFTITPTQSSEGTPVQAAAGISGPLEAVDSISWILDGTPIARTSSPSSAQQSVSIESPAAGNHSLQIRTTDIFGRTASQQANFSVFPPLELSILKPVEGQNFGPGEAVRVTGAVSDARAQAMIDRYYWEVDSRQISGSDFLSGTLPALSAGTHTLTLHAVDSSGNSSQAETTVTVQSDLILSLQESRDTVTMLEGTTQTFRVSARALSAQVDIGSLSEDIIWYVDGRTQESGLSFSFTPDEPGRYTLQARYDQGAVSRQTRELTVIAQGFPEARILQPEPDSMYYYSPNERITLSGTGFERASYSWLLDGAVIGRGREFSFLPTGLSGSYRLQLLSEFQGLTSTAEQMTAFQPNTAPAVSVNLSQERYFTGQNLEWNVSSLDIEEGSLQPTLSLDGIPIGTDSQIVFTDADIGTHELRARAVDSQGLVSEAQAAFSVAQGITGLSITSPSNGSRLIEGKPFLLTAEIQGGATAGEYQWDIVYYDAADQGSEQLSGRRVEFVPAAVGAAMLKARFVPENGQPAVEQTVAITIESQPAELTLYWPHGSVVNAGLPLSPEIIGEADDTEITYLLDGKSVTLENLRAPDTGGEHTLTARFEQGGRLTGSEQVQFTVNEAPRVRITSPAADYHTAAGSPVIFSAEVTDDQQDKPGITWYSNGQLLGTGAVLAVSDFTPGTHAVTAEASDRFGLTGTSEGEGVSVTVYQPLRIGEVSINNGIPTYLVGSDSHMPLSVALTGGTDVSSSWRVIQQETDVQAAGQSVLLDISSQAFTAGPAVVRLRIEQLGAVVLQQDYPIEFTDTAVISVTAPEADTPFWIDSQQTFELTAAGLRDPDISVSIDGTPTDSTLSLISSQGEEAVYDVTVDTSGITGEGVYETVFTAVSGNTSVTETYMMNMYEPEPGIEILSAPSILDLRSDQPATATAAAVGLEGTTLLWYSSASPELAAGGSILNLREAELELGLQTITVAALDGDGETRASASFELTVLGPMQLALSPENEHITVIKQADLMMRAKAVDTDGSILPGESVSWISHSAGTIATGNEFIPGTSSLEPGDHMLIIEALGASGERIQKVAYLSIRPSTGGTGSAGEPDQQEGPPPTGPRTDFSRGRGIGGLDADREVSTTAAVKGTVGRVRDGSRENVSASTSFRSDDLIELRGRNAQITLLITSTGQIVTLDERNANYVWDSSSSNWVEE
jgi:hypothetical protein